MTFIFHTPIPPLAHCWGHNRTGRSFFCKITAENDGSHPLFYRWNTLRENSLKRCFVSTSAMQGGDATLNFCHAYTLHSLCCWYGFNTLECFCFSRTVFSHFLTQTDWAVTVNFSAKKSRSRAKTVWNWVRKNTLMDSIVHQTHSQLQQWRIQGSMSDSIRLISDFLFCYSNKCLQMITILCFTQFVKFSVRFYSLFCDSQN